MASNGLAANGLAANGPASAASWGFGARPADMPAERTKPADAGSRMHALVSELYPICRSITGAGVRQTLAVLTDHIPVQMHEVPTGTAVFDWETPREWVVHDAYIKAPDGRRIVDFGEHNLHVVGYSAPVHKRMTLDELRPHLHTLPDRPDWIPYRTSYYNETWGFCLRERQLAELEPFVEYEVRIESRLFAGALTYGELLVPGRIEDEVLISCHICHPSLANDNLSGIAVAAELAKMLRARENRYSYRFVFVPGTIGALAWLYLNRGDVRRVKHGLVLTLLGDPGPINYKRSRRGNAEIDRAAAHVLGAVSGAALRDFTPTGYDERQYCSPGFNLPVGCLMRTPHGEFPEYHTSADNPDFVRPEALADSLDRAKQILDLVETNLTYRNLSPYGEPQLGRRGLYRAMGGFTESDRIAEAMQWVLNFSDGNHHLLDIAERSGLSFGHLKKAADLLVEHDLLEDCER